MIKKFFWFLCLFFLASCSSINKPQYYAFEPLTDLGGAKINHNRENRPIGFLYREGKKRGDHQSIFIEVKNVGFTTYTIGPLFLPIIPYFEKHPIDRAKPLEIVYNAYSGFSSEEQVKTIPELSIELPSGKTLPPISRRSCYDDILSCQIFTYDTTVEQTPEFVIQETVVTLENQHVLRTPKLKFFLKDSLTVDWFIAISP